MNHGNGWVLSHFFWSKWWLSGDCVLETVSFPIYFPDVSIVDQMSTPRNSSQSLGEALPDFHYHHYLFFFKTNESSGKLVNHPFTMVVDGSASMKIRPRRGVCGQSSLEICGSLSRFIILPILIASGLLGRMFFPFELCCHFISSSCCGSKSPTKRLSCTLRSSCFSCGPLEVANIPGNAARETQLSHLKTSKQTSPCADAGYADISVRWFQRRKPLNSLRGAAGNFFFKGNAKEIGKKWTANLEGHSASKYIHVWQCVQWTIFERR